MHIRESPLSRDGQRKSSERPAPRTVSQKLVTAIIEVIARATDIPTRGIPHVHRAECRASVERIRCSQP